MSNILSNKGEYLFIYTTIYETVFFFLTLRATTLYLQLFALSQAVITKMLNINAKNVRKSGLHYFLNQIKATKKTTCLIRAWSNGKCLATKQHQTLFGDQTFYRLATLFGAIF